MVDPTLSAAIWERYEREKPSQGREYSAWVAKIAAESATPQTVVRRVVAEGAGAMLNAISDRFQTFAQQIAEFMGAGLVSALETLTAGLMATKKKVLLDKSGRPKLLSEEADGPGYVPENMIYVEVPDWPSRLAAARYLCELNGARPPQQIEVNQKTVTLNLNQSDARAEIERLAEAIPRLQSALASIGEGNPRTARAGTTITVSASNPGRPLLDDGMHGDAR